MREYPANEPLPVSSQPWRRPRAVWSLPAVGPPTGHQFGRDPDEALVIAVGVAGQEPAQMSDLSRIQHLPCHSGHHHRPTGVTALVEVVHFEADDRARRGGLE